MALASSLDARITAQMAVNSSASFPLEIALTFILKQKKHLLCHSSTRSPDRLQGREKPYKLMRQIPVPAAEMIVGTSVRLDLWSVFSSTMRLLPGQIVRYSDACRVSRQTGLKADAR